MCSASAATTTTTTTSGVRAAATSGPGPSHSAAAIPGVGAGASAAPRRFRKGAAQLSPLERAAAAAHEALAGMGSGDLGPGIGRVVPVGPKGAGALGPRPLQPPPDDFPEAVPEDAAAAAAAGSRSQIIGVLQGVPHVQAASEHLASARKRVSRLVPSTGLRNEAAKARNLSARRLDALMKELGGPLRRYCDGFPDPDSLHPFERALLQLTVGLPLYGATLGRVDRLRKGVQEVGKSWASRAGNASSKAEAVALGEEGAAGIEAVYVAGTKHVDALRDIAKKLRSLPSLDPRLPTLALVGAPNVGKSSLVQVLSSGTPEVCNYPFTTRSIKMGHFYLDGLKHQVTDTPGLLNRPAAERNKMEALTLAALECLPSAVLYVVDLTEECGTSVADQWAIRSELRSLHPAKPWLDVFSKADMLQGLFDQADKAAAQHEQQQQQPGAPAADAPAEVECPADVAAALPRALRVSSLTQAGIPQLQLAIIHMLRASRQQQAALLAAQPAPAPAARQQ